MLYLVLNAGTPLLSKVMMTLLPYFSMKQKNS